MPAEYSEATGAPKKQVDRNVHETRQFRFAMCEMSRMYAFKHCEVIVLPTHDADGQPFDSVAITGTVTDVDGNSVDMSAWGRVNLTPYEGRGW